MIYVAKPAIVGAMKLQTTTSPLESYQEQLNADILQYDANQEIVVDALDQLYQELIQPIPWYRKLFLRPAAPHGIYLWGSVGTGKTYLIDIFFHALPFDNKLRMHFHAFMQVVHAELHTHKGKTNPLKFVAKEFASKARVICLDELIVNDITDAMMLTGLFRYLNHFGVCLLFTSNITPDRLYEKGLQRQRFLPAIELIKQHSNVIELQTDIDYRQKFKDHQFNYYHPLEDEALDERFLTLTEGIVRDDSITIHGRQIDVIKRSDNTIWFDFRTICGVPRSAKDFLTIADEFPNILISNLTEIDSQENNLIRSFINLIDVLYDNKNLVIISAVSPIYDIYPEGKFLFPFARTQSRITEMQAENWV